MAVCPSLRAMCACAELLWSPKATPLWSTPGPHCCKPLTRGTVHAAERRASSLHVELQLQLRRQAPAGSKITTSSALLAHHRYLEQAHPTIKLRGVNVVHGHRHCPLSLSPSHHWYPQQLHGPGCEGPIGGSAVGLALGSRVQCDEGRAGLLMGAEQAVTVRVIRAARLRLVRTKGAWYLKDAQARHTCVLTRACSLVPPRRRRSASIPALGTLIQPAGRYDP